MSEFPQRGVLGPTLLYFYVNDVSDIVVGNTTCKLFADDIKLYSCIEADGSLSISILVPQRSSVEFSLFFIFYSYRNNVVVSKAFIASVRPLLEHNTYK